MSKPASASAIVKAVGRLKDCSVRVSAFSGLRPDQLRWQPFRERWSIAECLAHLIVSNECYFPVIDRLADGKYQPSFWERQSPFSKRIGRNMVVTLGPDMQRSFKAPRLFEPKPRLVGDPAIIQRFMAHQDALIRKLESIRLHEPERCIITSPVAGLITLPLYDLLEVLPGHEERHLSQAERLMSEPGFPA